MWCRFGRAVILLCYLSHMAQMDLRSRCRLTAIQSRVVVLRHGDASCLYCHQSCGGSVHVSSGVAAVGARANHHPPARTQSAGGAHQGCHKQDLRAGVHWLGWPAGLQQQVVWRFRRHGFRVCLRKRISILGNDARSWSIATCRHVSSSVQYAKMNTDALVDFMFKLHWCSLSSDILCDARSTGLS